MRATTSTCAVEISAVFRVDQQLYATVTARVWVAAALLASRMARGRLKSPFTAREVYRNDWTG